MKKLLRASLVCLKKTRFFSPSCLTCLVLQIVLSEAAFTTVRSTLANGADLEPPPFLQRGLPAHAADLNWESWRLLLVSSSIGTLLILDPHIVSHHLHQLTTGDHHVISGELCRHVKFHDRGIVAVTPRGLVLVVHTPLAVFANQVAVSPRIIWSFDVQDLRGNAPFLASFVLPGQNETGEQKAFIPPLPTLAADHVGNETECFGVRLKDRLS